MPRQNNSNTSAPPKRNPFAPPTKRQKKLQKEARAKGGLTPSGIKKYYGGGGYGVKKTERAVQETKFFADIKKEDVRRTGARARLSRPERGLLRKLESQRHDRTKIKFSGDKERKRAQDIEKKSVGDTRHIKGRLGSEFRVIESGRISKKEYEKLKKEYTTDQIKSFIGPDIIRKLLKKKIKEGKISKPPIEPIIKFKEGKISKPPKVKGVYQIEKKHKPKITKKTIKELTKSVGSPAKFGATLIKTIGIPEIKNSAIIKKVSRRIQGAAQQGKFGMGVQQYMGQTADLFEIKTNKKGELYTVPTKSARGKQIKVAKSLVLGAAGGAAWATTEAKFLKFFMSKTGKRLKTAGAILYVKDVPFRLYRTGGKMDKIAVEFAGDLGFAGGAKGASEPRIRSNKQDLKIQKKYFGRVYRNRMPNVKRVNEILKKIKSKKEKDKLLFSLSKTIAEGTGKNIFENKELKGIEIETIATSTGRGKQKPTKKKVKGTKKVTTRIITETTISVKAKAKAPKKEVILSGTTVRGVLTKGKAKLVKTTDLFIGKIKKGKIVSLKRIRSKNVKGKKTLRDLAKKDENLEIVETFKKKKFSEKRIMKGTFKDKLKKIKEIPSKLKKLPAKSIRKVVVSGKSLKSFVVSGKAKLINSKDLFFARIKHGKIIAIEKITKKLPKGTKEQQRLRKLALNVKTTDDLKSLVTKQSKKIDLVVNKNKKGSFIAQEKTVLKPSKAKIKKSKKKTKRKKKKKELTKKQQEELKKRNKILSSRIKESVSTAKEPKRKKIKGLSGRQQRKEIKRAARLKTRKKQIKEHKTVEISRELQQLIGVKDRQKITKPKRARDIAKKLTDNKKTFDKIQDDINVIRKAQSVSPSQKKIDVAKSKQTFKENFLNIGKTIKSVNSQIVKKTKDILKIKGDKYADKLERNIERDQKKSLVNEKDKLSKLSKKLLEENQQFLTKSQMDKLGKSKKEPRKGLIETVEELRQSEIETKRKIKKDKKKGKKEDKPVQETPRQQQTSQGQQLQFKEKSISKAPKSKDVVIEVQEIGLSTKAGVFPNLNNVVNFVSKDGKVKLTPTSIKNGKVNLKISPKSEINYKEIEKSISGLKFIPNFKRKIIERTKPKEDQKPSQRFKPFQGHKQEQRPTQEIKEKFKQDQQHIKIQTLIKTTPPGRVINIPIPPDIPPPKIPGLDDKENKRLEELLKKLKKKKKKKFVFKYTPTLAGIGKVAKRTTGTFTGFEVRGSVIKPIIVKRHKRGNLRVRKFVKKHRRRKST